MFMQTRKVKNFIYLLIFLFLFSCSENTKMVEKKNMQEMSKIEHTLNNQRNYNFLQRKIALKPLKKKIDILDLARVSFYAKSISYKDAVVQILQSKSINVAFDSRLDTFITNPNIDLSLNNVSIRDALNTIVGIVGASWKKRDKIIWITPFETKTYDLGFLSIIRTSKSSLGGDVLGGGESGSDNNVTTPLKGNFSLDSKSSAAKGDIYKTIDNNIKKLLSKDGQFTLDQASGVLMVKDRPQNMKMVDRYIDAIYKSYNRQVIIEAKIVEVGLNKSWKFGIDWNLLSKNSKLGQVINLGQQTIDFGSSSPALKLDVSRIFHTSDTEITLGSVVNALSEFGAIRLVSEPHLRVMNSQPAILSVGRSISFIKSVEITQTSTGESTITTPDVNISSVFDGVLFGITPFIKGDGSVLLRIVPIKSNVVALREKSISGNTYTLPQVDLREASTVVSAQSGDVVVLGGLISRQYQKNDNGVPILSSMPGIGSLFKQQGFTSSNVELVILLKPVVVQ